MDKYLFASVFSVLSGTRTEEQNCWVIGNSGLTFPETDSVFPAAVPFYIPTSNV